MSPARSRASERSRGSPGTGVGETRRHPGPSTARFSFVAPVDLVPTITSISPSTGPYWGNTQVTITGTHLTGATVDFGAIAAASVSVSSDGTQILATTPPEPAGTTTVAVTVSTPLGGPAGTSPPFTFFAPAGPVKAWGDNTVGELGIGTTNGPQTCWGAPCSTTPVAVSGLKGVKAIAAGKGFGLALLANGTVEARGDNAFGELGDQDIANSSTPVQVTGLSQPVRAIAAGGDFGLALLANRTVMAWGRNNDGQLGSDPANGPHTCTFTIPCEKLSSRCSPSPVSVPGL